MAVNPKTLETPERGGLGLETREPEQPAGPEGELRALRERISAVRATPIDELAATPYDGSGLHVLHCRDCMDRGRRAVLALLDE